MGGDENSSKKSQFYLYTERPAFQILKCYLQFSSVQSLSRVQLFVTPWTVACQASLPITNSRSLPKLMSIESMMPSNHLILCHPLLLLPAIFPSIRVFSNESVLHIRWPKYWSFSFNISPSNDAILFYWNFNCLLTTNSWELVWILQTRLLFNMTCCFYLKFWNTQNHDILYEFIFFPFLFEYSWFAVLC